ncbi:MAG: hypothetical protein LAN61_09265 [Acidobacteriia bacterium]|nr:hypothetical protein [Terriglobia bacterium]
MAEVALRARDAEGSELALRVPAGILLAQLQQQGSSANTNLNQIGGASVSPGLYDSANTALKVSCVVGCSATGSFADNSAFTTGATGVTNISGLFNDAAANLTSGNAGAIRATTDRMLYVNIGKIAGSVPGLTGSSLNVNCTGGCSGSAGFTDNTGFTAGTSAESNIGGVFNDALAAVTSGNAAAARITSSRAMHVNLRNASGTEIGTAFNPLRTDPTGTTTQPVSGTVTANAGTGTFGVSGTVTGNQGTAGALAGAWPVKVTDGTNSMPTGDASARSIHVTADGLPALPTGGNTIGAVNLAQYTPAAGRLPVDGSGVTQPVSGTVTANQGGTWTVQPGNTANTTPWLTTDSADGNTGSAVPAKAAYLGGNASGNLTGVTVCDHWTPISLTANTQIITGAASKQTYVCSINLVAGAATNVAVVEGTGTTCATGIAGMAGGTTAATGWNFAANGGLTQGNGVGAIMRTATAADNVCILVSAANQVSGTISWTQF